MAIYASAIKKQLKDLLAPSLFEKNDALTRSNITDKLNDFLDDLTHAQSHLNIFDHKVVCDETNNDKACIINNEVKIDVMIQEAEENEPFWIPITIGENGCH